MTASRNDLTDSASCIENQRDAPMLPVKVPYSLEPPYAVRKLRRRLRVES